MTTEFYGLEPGGLLPATALAQLDTARMEVVAAGRPDTPSTTPYTATELNGMASGTVYRSTDGPQGAWEWQKRGSGWVVTQGDTGWVSLSPTPQFSVTNINIRRMNDHVALYIRNLRNANDLSAGLRVSIMSIPNGFRSNLYATLGTTWVGEVPFRFEVFSTSSALEGMAVGAGLSANSGIHAYLTYAINITTPIWPYTLPPSE